MTNRARDRDDIDYEDSTRPPWLYPSHIDWTLDNDDPIWRARMAEPDRFESYVARVTVAIAVLIVVYFAAQLLRAVM